MQVGGVLPDFSDPRAVSAETLGGLLAVVHRGPARGGGYLLSVLLRETAQQGFRVRFRVCGFSFRVRFVKSHW